MWRIRSVEERKRMQRESGTGILEFSPTKAGQDVTPANFDFDRQTKEIQKATSRLASIAGLYS